MMYLIWSNEHNGWWRRGGLGYTGSIQDAGRYTMEDALIICNQSNYDWEIPEFARGIRPDELPIAEEIAILLSYKIY